MTDSGTERRTQVLDDLESRGLIAHSTDPDALRAAMAAGPITSYVGFDPTAPSLHMGNLLQLLTLRRLQLAGHNPIGLVGGATGLIGDPKESSERVLNPKDVVRQWVERVRGQVEKFIDFDQALPNPGRIVNNYDWTKDLNTLDFLRDIGKHFPVNRMLGREVVKARLEQGISYTEFSYVLLQSLDYLELYRRHDCTLQTGGSDQWGNLTAGVELIRRTDAGKAHALATPLVTKADGTKFGKTESGTVWLDRELTSPYAFYQFWFNTDDRDVMQLVRFYTFRTAEEIAALEQATAERPHAREAQQTARRGRHHAGARRGGDQESAGGVEGALRPGGARLPRRLHTGRRTPRSAPRRTRRRRTDADVRRPAREVRSGRQQVGRAQDGGRRRRVPEQREGEGRRVRAWVRRPAAGWSAGAAAREAFVCRGSGVVGG